MNSDTTIHEYVTNQKRLLELELKSEEEEEANQRSHVPQKQTDETSTRGGGKSRILSNLKVEEWSIGLMGRTVITLVSMKGNGSGSSSSSSTNGGKEAEEDKSTNEKNVKKSDMPLMLLPSHRITVGDEVEIMSKHNNDQMSKSSSSEKKRKKSGGVVSAVTDTMISIALYGNQNHKMNHNSNQKESSNNKSTTSTTTNDQQQEEETQLLLGSPPLIVVPKSSVEVHKKMVHVLNQLQDEGLDHPFAGSVIRSVFDPSAATIGMKSSSISSDDSADVCDNTMPSFCPFNPNLDESQIEAIKFCLEGQQPISLIHGPPGTGKTTTVAELIHQAVHVHNLRVLITAPSNVAVDNVLERLVLPKDKTINDHGKKNRRKRGKNSNNTTSTTSNTNMEVTKIRAVRLGHPARIQPSILKYSLEALVQNADGTEIVSDIRSELQSYLKVVSNPKSKGMEKRTAYKEMKLLRKEIRQREEKVVHGLIANAQVVLATNVGASSFLLNKYEKSSMGRPFDLVIIDEAAQALEVSCWIPILRGKRLVLAGDHCQLPPTIKSSNREVQKELSRTMFERIMNYNQVSRMLKIQYRMHEDIANWASEAMYHGKLLSHETVKSRKLFHLSHVDEGTSTNKKESNHKSNTNTNDSLLASTRTATLLLIDTAGCDMFESTNVSGSRYNEGEATLVQRHVQNLIKIGLKEAEIAIITPYNGQVEVLKNMLLGDFPKLEIRSVDGFQGGEREAVVLSLVRSSDRNGANGVGFLRDKRRLNVAITRAKRQCAVICDSDTVSQNDFLKGLVTWIESKGEYFSAMEYDNNETQNQQCLSGFSNIIDERSQKMIGNENILISDDASKKKGSQAINLKMSEKSSSMKPADGIINKANAKQTQYNSVDERIQLSRKDDCANEMSAAEIVSDNKPKVEEISNLSNTQNDLSRIEPNSYDSGNKMDENNSKCQNKGNKSRNDLENKTKIAEETPKLTAETKTSNTHNFGEKTENMNSLLGTLARERQARAQVQPKTGSKKATKKKKSKGGKKLSTSKQKIDKVEIDDDLDDMAFLDAQIEKVQTSHGRKVEGSGKNYKAIVNGVLIAKPVQQEKKKDSRLSGALSSKIKQSQNKRKTKKK